MINEWNNKLLKFRRLLKNFVTVQQFCKTKFITMSGAGNTAEAL